MKNIILILSLLVSLNIQSQESYTTAEGQVHLLGDIDLNHLEKEPYAEWFLKNPEQSYKLLDPSLLKEVNVRIFIGTWCGDTQKLLPEFVSLWKKNGLSESQLKITALHSEGDQYKRSPNQEEEQFQIHRVPTLIFTRNGEEIGRIVESPINDLLTDIEQIASGIPSRPRYRAASMFLETVHTTPVDTLFEKAHYKKLVDDLSYMVSKYNELNTLGYVLKARGKMREAELAFALNMSIFEFEPNCWYAMGKHKYDLGENKEAKDLLTRVLDFYPESKNTKAMLEKIEERS